MRNPDTLQEVVEGKVAEVGGKERFTLKLPRTVARYFEAVFRSISSGPGFGDCVVPSDCLFHAQELQWRVRPAEGRSEATSCRGKRANQLQNYTPHSLLASVFLHLFL